MNMIARAANSRYFVWALLALPFPLLTYSFAREYIFYGEMLHATGVLAVRLLIVALAVTPLSRLFPGAAFTRWLRRHRRYVGVAAFAYALLHTAVYVDKKAALGVIVREGLAFDMWTGWLSLFVLLVLALTSNDSSVRRLGRRWKRVHRWVHAAAVLAFAHWLFIAFDFVPALLHLLLLAALQALRLWLRRRDS